MQLVKIKKMFAEIQNVVFPKLCLHCKEKTSEKFFCDSCLESFVLLEEKEIPKLEGVSYPLGVCFENIGPMKTLVWELKKMQSPTLTKVLASYMVYQYFNLKLPSIDFISPLNELGEGFKFTEIIAKEISSMMQKPMKKLFFEAKIAMLQSSFFIKKTNLQDKKVLLIIEHIEEKKIKKALENLEKQGFKEIVILGLIQN